MSNPNINLSNFDTRYSKPADVSAAISAQAMIDAGQYARKTKSRTALPGMLAGVRMQSAISATVNTVGTSRLTGQWTINGSTVRVVFGNFSYSGDSNPVSPIMFKAALEPTGDNATIIPLTFQSNTVATLNAGILISDPVPVPVILGGDWAVRTYLVAGTAQATFAGSSYKNDGFTAGVDLTASGSSAVATSFTFQYGPLAVLADPLPGTSAPVIGIMGDSIAYGQGDGNGQNRGFIMRALGWIKSDASLGGTPLGSIFQAAVPGETATTAATGDRFRSIILADCTDVISNYGTNDRAQGRSASQIQKDLISVWSKRAGFGTRVWQCTITPRSTSTDNFATTTNQTPIANDAARASVNAWLRAGAPMVNGLAAAIGTVGAVTCTVYGVTGQVVVTGVGVGHPLAGVFDTAATVESGGSSSPSGVYIANGTANYYSSDGIHPNSPGHALMAGAIPTSVFASGAVAPTQFARGDEYAVSSSSYVPASAYATGAYYSTPGARTTITRPNGYITLMPFKVESVHSFTGIAAEVVAAGNAGSIARLGIYLDSSGQPGALLNDYGSIAADSTGIKTITGLTVALSPGMYWLATNIQGAISTVPTWRGITGSTVLQGAPLATGSGTLQNGVGYQHSTTVTSGNLPAILNPGITDTVVGTALIA